MAGDRRTVSTTSLVGFECRMSLILCFRPKSENPILIVMVEEPPTTLPADDKPKAVGRRGVAGPNASVTAVAKKAAKAMELTILIVMNIAIAVMK